MKRTYQPKKLHRKKENVHKERPQGAVPQKSKGQKDALLLIYDYAFL